MSNSEDSFDEDDYVPLSKRFRSIIRPKLDTEQMHALQESVRKENWRERESTKIMILMS